MSGPCFPFLLLFKNLSYFSFFSLFLPNKFFEYILWLPAWRFYGIPEWGISGSLCPIPVSCALSLALFLVLSNFSVLVSACYFILFLSLRSLFFSFLYIFFRLRSSVNLASKRIKQTPGAHQLVTHKSMFQSFTKSPAVTGDSTRERAAVLL